MRVWDTITCLYHKNLRIILHLFQSCRALSDRSDEMWILYRHPGESLWLRPRSLPCAWYGGIWLAENIPTTCLCHRIRNAPGCPGQPQQGCGQSLLLCQRPQLWGVSLGCSQIVLCYRSFVCSFCEFYNPTLNKNAWTKAQWSNIEISEIIIYEINWVYMKFMGWVFCIIYTCTKDK